MVELSDAAQRLRGQAAFKVLEKAEEMEAQGADVLHFEIGEPDFDTPTYIKQSAMEALKRGETTYVNSKGIVELRRRIQEEVERTRGFRPDIDQILVTPGGNVNIFLTISCLVNGDETVIYPDPGFFSYSSTINYLDREAQPVPLLEENKFRLDPTDVRERIDENTKLIIMNSPSNPTGSMMKKGEIEEMAEIAQEHECYLLSDEVYKEITYGRGFHSPSPIDECKERTIILDSFSKEYAMTGWRLGYAVGPAKLIEKMSLLIQTTVSCTAPFIQWGGRRALERHKFPKKMVDVFRKRRDTLIKGLNQLPDIHCVKPTGAFYAFPNIKDTGMSSAEFSEFLLEKGKIATLSGAAFGAHGEGYIRLSYATSLEDIKEALKRMEDLL